MEYLENWPLMWAVSSNEIYGEDTVNEMLVCVSVNHKILRKVKWYLL